MTPKAAASQIRELLQALQRARIALQGTIYQAGTGAHYATAQVHYHGARGKLQAAIRAQDDRAHDATIEAIAYPYADEEQAADAHNHILERARAYPAPELPATLPNTEQERKSLYDQIRSDRKITNRLQAQADPRPL